MSPPHLRWSSLRPVLAIAGGVAAIVLLLAWLMGAFHAAAPERAPAVPRRAPAGTELHRVAVIQAPQFETAVGTIRPIYETQVASRVLARIAVMHVQRAGQVVRQGDVLVVLEDADLQAALEQAKAALRSAESTAARAKADLERTQELFRSGVAAQDRVDRDLAALRGADAEVQRSAQVVAAAATALTFATIRAPIGGMIIDKHANTGDIAQPGQVLVTLYDPTRLQLVAIVREELATRLQLGSEVEVVLEALGKVCTGTVDQIVPQAEARTRSFEVKVIGPCEPGVLSGMFGRLRVPVGTREEIRVPVSAVQSIGQLDFVYAVLPGGELQRRLVRTGRRFDGEGQVEVLAGVAPGEELIAVARSVDPR